jgi:prepilin-type N-terminal cleavage/methylation domain-containing protein
MIPTGARKSRKGFGLIEVLVSVLIIGIGLFIISAVFYTQTRTINQLREKVIATLAAQEELEYIRGMPFTTIINAGTVFPNPSSFTTALKYNNPTLNVAVDNYLNDPGTDIRRVTVTISWQSITGNTLTRSLSTLVMNNGIDKQ